MPRPRTLSWPLVRAVREAALDHSVSYAKIGERFGIRPERVASLVAGYDWKDPDYTPVMRTSHKYKLTWPQVRQIRAAYMAGATARTLAVLYGVSHVAIHKIVTGKVYRKDPSGVVYLPIHRVPQRTNKQRKAA
jgi:hypothetical protein